MANLPVPVPRTFQPSEIETGANYNSLRDALNFLLNPPEAIVYGSAVQSINNATATALAFDATTIDTYGGHSNTTNNTRYTAQVAGTHLVIGTYASAPNAAGGRNIQVAKNGVAVAYAQGDFDVNQGNNHMIQVSALVVMNAGDYVEVWGYQNSGGALNTIASDSSMQVLWVHS